MKHFEEIYEDAEKLSENVDTVSSNYFQCLIEDLELLESLMNTSTSARQQEIFGDILFSLCAISKKLNINAYEALQNAMNKIRAEIFDDE